MTAANDERPGIQIRLRCKILPHGPDSPSPTPLHPTTPSRRALSLQGLRGEGVAANMKPDAGRKYKLAIAAPNIRQQ